MQMRREMLIILMECMRYDITYNDIATRWFCKFKQTSFVIAQPSLKLFGIDKLCILIFPPQRINLPSPPSFSNWI